MAGPIGESSRTGTTVPWSSPNPSAASCGVRPSRPTSRASSASSAFGRGRRSLRRSPPAMTADAGGAVSVATGPGDPVVHPPDTHRSAKLREPKVSGSNPDGRAREFPVPKGIRAVPDALGWQHGWQRGNSDRVAAGADVGTGVVRASSWCIAAALSRASDFPNRLPPRAARRTICGVSLNGPSRRILSEPIEKPAVEPAQPPEPEPCPEPREPAREPEPAMQS